MGMSAHFHFTAKSGAANWEGLAEVSGGLVAGTKVATPLGWRPVEGLVPGDRVLTFDRGMQDLRAVHRRTILTEGRAGRNTAHWPLAVPQGVLGNRETMLLLPQQPVIVESDAAEMIYGDPFAMIPAAALEGYRGITRVEPAGQFNVISLEFAQDEVVFANVGALFHCPVAGDLLTAAADPEYAVIEMAQAADLVAHLAAKDVRAA